jgi:hypothetical protein
MFLGLPDPDPDPLVKRYGSGSGSFPFSHKGVGRTEIMLAKIKCLQNFSKKLNFKTEDR